VVYGMGVVTTVGHHQSTSDGAGKRLGNGAARHDSQPLVPKSLLNGHDSQYDTISGLSMPPPDSLIPTVTACGLTGIIMNHPRAPFELPPAPEALAARLTAGSAIAWSSPVVIPTYEPAESDRYPMFLDRRVYQGSSGRVYPIPFTDSIATEATPHEWQAVHLENEWIRLMVLPELGGRIHVGFDKTANYDFFYRNTVIKPALVGLAGPWISGGVEFNWPQHHRPATFLPVDFTIEEGEDGSVTVWNSDHDPFDRMKGMHGVRLHPNRAVVELVVRLHNRTSEVHTFLWWANVAARVHDDYQSFFPTDVQFVADHARRAITAFPAADRPYYGVDYPARAAEGGDRLDWYRNIPVPTSYMIVDTKDDFFGGYDHAAGAGFVHVADRHIAPGKKQWTWGDAAFGHAWDALLTDHDGPYVELMAGVYTDNQPDFAWLMPGETKAFTQTWYPIQQIGVVHQANLDAAVHLEVSDGVAEIGVALTSPHSAARVVLCDALSGEQLSAWQGELGPGCPYTEKVAVGGRPAIALELVVASDAGELIRWRPRETGNAVEPASATEPPRPDSIESADELFLTGTHLAQYRHPTRSPLPYWQEAVARDPRDVRSNVALADHHYRAGSYERALSHLDAAFSRLTARNLNPFDGEASYLRGLVLRRLDRVEEAYDSFAKATWDGKWEHAALVELARLDAAAGRTAQALLRVQRAHLVGAGDSRALGLEALLLRQLGREDESRAVIAATLRDDPLDQMALAVRDEPSTADERTVIDVALEFAAMGDTARALSLLERAAQGSTRPIALYHAAALLDRDGDADGAAQARARAAAADTDRCFPSGLDDHDALCAAAAANPTDGQARALLAMLLHDRGRTAEALGLWQEALDCGLQDPVTMRNAAIAVYNLRGDFVAAKALYEQALAIAAGDARLWYEFDQLLARTGATVSQRLDRLDPKVALQRDDLAVEYCDLLTAAGRADEAVAILISRRFAPWEGGEGRTLAAWEHANLALARRAADAAATLLFADRALNPPESIGEARHPLAPTGHIEGVRTMALRALGREGEIVDAPMPSTPERGGAADYFATSLPELLLFAPLGTQPAPE
jgi:tetratricopeptide (TPR) repeat protein